MRTIHLFLMLKTLKLTYKTGATSMLRFRKPRSVEDSKSNDHPYDQHPHIASIFDSKYIKPKEVEEVSGERVKIVDVVRFIIVCFILSKFNFFRTAKIQLLSVSPTRVTSNTLEPTKRH